MKKKGFLTLYKYVFSYITVALIPIIIVMLLSYRFFIQEYQNEVEENRASTLMTVRNSFDMMLGQMENIVKQIQMEDDLYYNMQDEFDTAIKLKNRLSKYQNSSTYLKDILFYLRDSDTICAASSTYSLDSYAETVNSMTGIDTPTFRSYLNEVDMRLVLPSRRETMMGFVGAEVTTFIYPLPYLESSPYATVMFKIETNVIRNIFSPDNQQNYSIIIHSGGEDVIISGDQRYEPEIRQFLKSGSITQAQGSFTQPISGEDYMISYLKNAAGDVTYLYMMPSHIALKQVETLRMLFIVIMFALIFVELGVLFFVAYKNYQPIKSLKDFLSHNFSSSDNAGRAGFEIQTAEKILADMAVTHKHLNEQLALNQDTLREVILYKMINGGFSDLQELTVAQHSSGIIITQPYLRIAILQLLSAAESSPYSSEELLSLFRSHLPDRQIYHCRFSDKEVFVISDEQPGEREYHEAFSRICTLLKEQQEPTPFCIGLSDVCDDISMLHLSYIQANSALDYRFISGENNVFFYSEIMSDQDIYRFYPRLEIGEIAGAILADSRDRFELLVNQVLSQMKEHSSNLILAKLVSYDVVNIILKATLESGKGFTHINGKAPNIICLSATHSVEELIGLVSNVRDETLKYLGQKEQSSNSLMERVIEVINNNVYDYNFSVKQLADQFGISQNNLSQQFKRYTNQTPSDYINFLRLEKAKYHLANSDMPIRVLVEKLGYSNESSFIRKFKDAMGVTPGEYRRRIHSLHGKS